MVDNLIAAYWESTSTLDWTTAETKQWALEKLDSFVLQIGYLTQWKDYSALNFAGTDLISMDRQAAQFDSATKLAKIWDRFKATNSI